MLRHLDDQLFAVSNVNWSGLDRKQDLGQRGGLESLVKDGKYYAFI